MLRATAVPVPEGGQFAVDIGIGNTTFLIAVTVALSQAVITQGWKSSTW